MYQDKIVLCGANSYEEKFYMNPDFDNLPQHIKDELKIMCVLYVHDVGGILTLVFEENGELEFEVTSAEGDPMFDEIGSRLKIKEIQTDEKKQELLTQLQLYYPEILLRRVSSSVPTHRVFSCRPLPGSRQNRSHLRRR